VWHKRHKYEIRLQFRHDPFLLEDRLVETGVAILSGFASSVSACY